MALQDRRRPRPLDQVGDALRQHGRLVESATQQTPAMQWNRENQVGVAEQLLAGLGHPAREQGDPVQPATALEAQNEPATVAVVTQSGAAAVEGRRLGGTTGAERCVDRSVRQGKAAAATPGRSQEAQPAPAFGAQAVGSVDLDAAGETSRRQHQVERTATDASKQAKAR